MAKHNDLDPVKKPYQVERFTREQIDELRKCSEDIFYFISNYVYVIDISSGGSVLFDPFEYQRDMIRAFIDNRNVTVMAGRQLGKTTCAVAYLLWRAVFNDEETILVVSNVFSAASEIMERFRFAYEMLPNWMKPGVKSYNKNSIVFENASRVIARATTRNTGRGLSISVLYCDELAAVDRNKQEEFWTAIRPTLSTGGKCIITSTPSSDEDVFAQIWFGALDTFDEYGAEDPNGIGKNGFKAVKFTWRVHPKRGDEWEKSERAAMGDAKFEREHNCEFINANETLIDPFVLARLTGADPIFITGNIRWFKHPEPEKTYLVTLDPSMGTGGDFAAIEVFELPNMNQVAEWQNNKTSIPNQIRILSNILEYIKDSIQQQSVFAEPEIYWTIENNSIGEAANIVIKEIGEEKFPGTFLSESRKSVGGKRVRKGFNTTHKNKVEACTRLKSLVEREKITIRSKPLVSQLKSFVARGASYAAKSGDHDDLVSALLLNIRLVERVMRYDENVHENLKETAEYEGREPMPVLVVTTRNR